MIEIPKHKANKPVRRKWRRDWNSTMLVLTQSEMRPWMIYSPEYRIPSIKIESEWKRDNASCNYIRIVHVF